MKKKNIIISFILIIVIAVFGFAVSFPHFFNIGTEFLNKGLVKVGISIPNVPEDHFKLGLDLQGGSHLTYEADLENYKTSQEKREAMEGIRDVIERRVNLFGVGEPKVQIEERMNHYRLIVELPGVKDTQTAAEMIGETPFLEFREERESEETKKMLEESGTPESGPVPSSVDPYFKATELTGKYLKNATMGFNETTLEPEVLLEFDKEGSDIFAELTKNNSGESIAIYIDNVLISAPVVREAILGGKAQITGQFTIDEARDLVRNFNAGALPVPIELISETTIGPALGKISLERSLKAGIIGLLAVLVYMLFIYRLSGLIAGLSLGIYGFILLTIFKLLPVTLTLAGIGGAILSIGMAVDANVLVFERYREERKKGENFERAVKEAFKRAWPSIRDGNFTTLLIAFIMFSFGTSFVKGFSLTLSLGILVSLFSSLFVTRTFLLLFAKGRLGKVKWIWS